MLEQYYVRPITVDRFRGSWIALPLEQYVEWLTAQRYTRIIVSRRIPLLVAFGEFAKSHARRRLRTCPIMSNRSFECGRLNTEGRRSPHGRAKRLATSRATLSARCCVWRSQAALVAVVPIDPIIPLRSKRRTFLRF